VKPPHADAVGAALGEAREVVVLAPVEREVLPHRTAVGAEQTGEPTPVVPVAVAQGEQVDARRIEPEGPEVVDEGPLRRSEVEDDGDRPPPPPPPPPGG